jgi:hypothetical protein
VRPFLLALVIALVTTTSALAKPAVRPVEPFLAATPRADVVLRDRPGGKALATVGTHTEYGSPLKVGVVASRGSWVGVISTALPNGVLGWVPRKDLTLRPVAWSIEISLRARTIVVRKNGEVVRRMPVGIGAASSPTPVGRYVVTDHIDPARYGTSAYGCCILALSGHQTNLPPGWTGGDRLAIHGGSTGGAVSTGCLHAGERDLRYLMRIVPLGAQIVIHP